MNEQKDKKICRSMHAAWKSAFGKGTLTLISQFLVSDLLILTDVVRDRSPNRLESFSCISII